MRWDGIGGDGLLWFVVVIGVVVVVSGAVPVAAHPCDWWSLCIYSVQTRGALAQFAWARR